MKTFQLFLLLLLVLALGSCRQEQPIPDWSSITQEPFPVKGVQEPILTAQEVTDRDAQFVADPFLFHKADTWYLFFEVYTDPVVQGDIGLATSKDGQVWTYDRIVLDEPFHLSYPYVFESRGEYYMIPETSQPKDIRLYKSSHFPYDWTYVATLVTGRVFVDPSILYYNGRWWLFVGDADNKTLYLFSSTTLTKGWKEHPLSPIVIGDRTKARPAGRVFIYDKDKIIRTAQANMNGYQAVLAFQVDMLDTERYADHEIPESPLLAPGANPRDWYLNGMHQFDPWWDGDGWMIAFDGRDGSGNYSIAITRTVQQNP